MHKRIRELYRDRIQDTRYMNEINQHIQREIAELLQEEETRMDWQEYEEYRDKVFQISSIAEEGGFIKGFKYAVRLMTECFT